MCVHVNAWYSRVSLTGRGAEVGGVQLLHILHGSSQQKSVCTAADYLQRMLSFA